MFGYISSHLTKLNSGLKLVLDAYFLHIFIHGNFFYIILFQLIKFSQQTLLISQDIKQFVFFKFHFRYNDDARNFRIYSQLAPPIKSAMPDRGKNRGRGKSKKLNILRTKGTSLLK